MNEIMKFEYIQMKFIDRKKISGKLLCCLVGIMDVLLLEVHDLFVELDWTGSTES